MSLSTRRVKISEIEPPSLPLREMDDHTFKSLVESMADLGYVEPIQVVEKCGGGYRLVNGFHRFQVLTEVMGVDEVDVVVLGKMCCEGEKTGDCWTEEDYYLNAIRLNNIHADWRKDLLRDVVTGLLKSYRARGLSEERLFKKLGRLDAIGSVTKKRKTEGNPVERAVASACREIARGGYEEHGAFVVFTYGGRLVMVYPIGSKSDFYEIVSYLEELGARGKSLRDVLAEAIGK